MANVMIWDEAKKIQKARHAELEAKSLAEGGPTIPANTVKGPGPMTCIGCGSRVGRNVSFDPYEDDPKRNLRLIPSTIQSHHRASLCEACLPGSDIAAGIVEAYQIELKRMEDRKRQVYATLPNEKRGVGFDAFIADTPLSEQALQISRDRLAKGDLPPFTTFAGMVGRGKTYLAACIAQELILTKGWRVAWADEAELKPRWHAASWTKYDEDIHELRAELIEADLLVVDDLGKSQVGPASSYPEFVFGVLQTRLSNLSPTLITTNHTVNSLESHYGGNVGPAICSRLREGIWLPIAGHDRRGSAYAN